jgi:hypothetical protein
MTRPAAPAGAAPPVEPRNFSSSAVSTPQPSTFRAELECYLSWANCVRTLLGVLPTIFTALRSCVSEHPNFWHQKARSEGSLTLMRARSLVLSGMGGYGWAGLECSALHEERTGGTLRQPYVARGEPRVSAERRATC